MKEKIRVYAEQCIHASELELQRANHPDSTVEQRIDARIRATVWMRV